MSGFLVTGALLEDTGEITASGSPVVLTPESATILKLSGQGLNGSDQILRLPNVSTLQPGVRYYLANRSGVPAEIQSHTTTPFARVEPGFEGEFRLLQSGTWDASVYPSVKVGAEDLNLTLVCNGQWTWQNSQLSVTQDAFVQVPGLPLTHNRISKFPLAAIVTYTLSASLAADLAGGYITLALLPTTLLPDDADGIYFWLKVGTEGEDPLLANKISYMVQVSSGASIQDVAVALSAAINSEASDYVSSSVDNLDIIVETKIVGTVTDPESSTGIDFEYTQAPTNILNLAGDGTVAYVKLRRSVALPATSPLEIFITTLESLDTSDADLFIVAQNISSKLLVGKSLKLIEGQTAELHASASAKGIQGSIQYNRGDNVLTASNDFLWNENTKTLSLGDLKITALSSALELLNNQTTPQSIVTFNIATHKHIVIEYSLLRNGSPQLGHIFIVNDGDEVSLADNFVCSSSLGIQFNASASEGLLSLSYTSSDTGYPATFRYSMRYWA